MTAQHRRAMGFVLLAIPFFLNDFGFIALNGIDGVYFQLRRLWPVVLAHWAENFLAFGPIDLRRQTARPT